MASAFGKKRLVFGLLIALFLMINTGGGFATQMMDDSAASNCPYMGAPVLCAMNPLQHLSEWQQMFAATVQQTSTVIFLLFALCAALLSVRPHLLKPRVIRGYRYRSPPSIPQRQRIIRWLSLFENSPSQA